MSLLNRQKFMQVKEKLDYYRLPTIFPPQATGIISKLLQKIEQRQSKITDKTTQSIRSSQFSPKNRLESQSLTNESSHTIFILETKIKKLVKQNGLLNLELLEAKQFIEALKQCKYLKQKCDQVKLKSPRSTDPINFELNSLKNGFQILKARQIELFQELTHVKYKYNELMQFLHENSNNQKQYIKRLLKYKKLEINLENNPKNIKTQNNLNIESDISRNIKITSNIDINKVITQNCKLQSLNKTLKLKIQNREIEILRLQTKLIDQFNVDSLVKTFHLQQKNNQIVALKNQIELLLGNSNTTKINHDQNKNHINMKDKKQNEKNTLKSPQIVKNIKSPSKNSLNAPLIDSKSRIIQKQRKSVRSPEAKNDLQILRGENQSLKRQIKDMKMKIELFNKQAKFPLNNQAIKDSIQKVSSGEKIVSFTEKQGQNLIKKQINQFEIKQIQRNLEKIIIQLKAELSEKNILIREMENKLNQTQRLVQTLKLKIVKNDEQPFQKDNFYHIYEENIKKEKLNKIQISQHNENDSQKIVQIKKKSSLFKNKQFEKPTESKSTNFYTSSQHEKSQKNDLSDRHYSQKKQIDLKSKDQTNRIQPSNINSRISSQIGQISKKEKIKEIQKQLSSEKQQNLRQFGLQQQKIINNQQFKSQKHFSHAIGQKSQIKNQKQLQKQKLEDSGPAFIIISETSQKEKIKQSKKQSNQFINKKVFQNRRIIESKQSQLQINYQKQSFENDNQSFVSSDSDKISGQKETQTFKDLKKPIKTDQQEVNNNELGLMKQFQSEQSRYQEKIFILESKLAQLEEQNQQLKFIVNSNEFGYQKQDVFAKQKVQSTKINQKLTEYQEHLKKAEIKIKQKDKKINSFQQQLQLKSLKVRQVNQKIEFLEKSLDDLKNAKSNSINPGKINSKKLNDSVQENSDITKLQQKIEILQKQLKRSQQSFIQLKNFQLIQKKEIETIRISKLKIQKQNDILRKKLLELQKFLKIQSEQMKRYRNIFGF